MLLIIATVQWVALKNIYAQHYHHIDMAYSLENI